MNKQLLIISICLIGMIISLNSSWAAPSTFGALSPQQIGDLLKRLNQTHETKTLRSGEPIYLLKSNGARAIVSGLLCKEDGCHTIRVSSVFSVTLSDGLELLNEWNSNHRFSRAYIDSDNDVMLVADIDLDGGITDQDAQLFFEIFLDQLGDFRQALQRGVAQ